MLIGNLYTFFEEMSKSNTIFNFYSTFSFFVWSILLPQIHSIPITHINTVHLCIFSLSLYITYAYIYKDFCLIYKSGILSILMHLCINRLFWLMTHNNLWCGFIQTSSREGHSYSLCFQSSVTTKKAALNTFGTHTS